MNLPPFYKGQKVVALVTLANGGVIKDKVYTAGDCFRCACGMWCMTYGVAVPGKADGYWTCHKCDHRIDPYPFVGWYGTECADFAPLQEQTAPLIKLSQIQEKEKKKADPLILIEN